MSDRVMEVIELNPRASRGPKGGVRVGTTTPVTPGGSPEPPQQPMPAPAPPAVPSCEYRPQVLQQRVLITVICCLLAVIAILLGLSLKPNFQIRNEWAYFAVRIGPTAVGTATAAVVQDIMFALSRITPFMRCAAEGGDTMGNTILRGYVPLLPLREAYRTRSRHLYPCVAVRWGLDLLVGFKAALLTTYGPGFGRAEISYFVLWILVGIYGALVLYVTWVLWFLRGRATGLREGWDMVTIADHLSLFRNSDFLHMFEGTCIAQRGSMVDTLGDLRIKLQHWDLEGSESKWFGFKLDPPGQALPATNDENESPSYTAAELSKLRYNSVYTAIQPHAVYLMSGVAFLLLTLYVFGLVAVHVRASGEVVAVPVSDYMGSLLLFAITTFVVAGWFGWVWGSMFIFVAITEPFRAMSRDGGATAEEALLLNYACAPSPVVAYEAFGRRHWKVMFAALFALAQRLLPIFVAGSVVVRRFEDDPGNSRSGIEFFFPLSLTAAIYFAAYVVLIPLMAFRGGYSRHLPRDPHCIGDLLSWVCSSRLLRADEVEAWEDKTRPVAGNPLDTLGTDPKNQKWHMESRLRLAHQRYWFDLEEVTAPAAAGADAEANAEADAEDASNDGDKNWAIGFKSSNGRVVAKKIPFPEQPVWTLNLFRRRRRRRRRGGDVEPAAPPPTRYKIAGAGRFSLIDGPENHEDQYGMANDGAAGPAVSGGSGGGL